MKTKDLNFQEAMEAISCNLFVTLPEWDGYWFKNQLTGIINVMLSNGNIVDTPYDDYRERKDWYVTDGSRDFGGAIRALKGGKKVVRKGWNGKNMWLSYLNPYLNDQFTLHEKEIEGTFAPYIGMKTADNQYVPWLASQTDMLATDWFIL